MDPTSTLDEMKRGRPTPRQAAGDQGRGCTPDAARKAIVFPDGLIGCPEWRRFVLLPGPPGSPAMRLQCLSHPSVCFVVADPRRIQPDYQLTVSREEMHDLGLDDSETMILCTLTVRDDPPTVTANLLAPLVVNPRSGLGKQIVLADSGYSARHPLGVARGPDERPAGAGG